MTSIPRDRLRNLGPATIVRGDARRLPLPDDSIDLVVTSPPYFALRSYQDDGTHYAGQVGAEATPDEFVDALLDCTREMVRVVKPTGSIWVNLGDKYALNNRGSGYAREGLKGRETSDRAQMRRVWPMREKSLVGLPWRYALRCIDDLDLILRAEVIWSKPNGLPESVTDRVRRSHEQWFHFTLSPRYYSAVDEIREDTHRLGLTWQQRKMTNARTHAPENGHMSGGPGMAANRLGKLPSSVWSIATEPLIVPADLGVDHFAAFPPEWPRRIIMGWSPSGICVDCEQGRRPVVDLKRHGGRVRQHTDVNHLGSPRDGAASGYNAVGSHAGYTTTTTIVGYACGCTPFSDHQGTSVARDDDRATGLPPRSTRGQLGAAPTVGAWREYHFDQWTPPPTSDAVVLDPFGGTGTTAMVARALGRHGVTVDLSADYCQLARWRVTHLDQLAAVQGLARSGRHHERGQDLLSLLDEIPT